MKKVAAASCRRGGQKVLLLKPGNAMLILMIKVVKRKLHSSRENPWREASLTKRLEAVEIISGIKKGKDAEQAFPRVHRITRKK